MQPVPDSMSIEEPWFVAYAAAWLSMWSLTQVLNADGDFTRRKFENHYDVDGWLGVGTELSASVLVFEVVLMLTWR